MSHCVVAVVLRVPKTMSVNGLSAERVIYLLAAVLHCQNTFPQIWWAYRVGITAVLL